ncbi:FtsK SpoIIIE family DNA translocase [Lacticaseibacillus thailandensis DSM 22698 = JCM 13996]|uniref:DNA translocase FtsK n=1 Tax=Lacticaseibacillus thailandensis DSM 22698 = JCM 13996 TaxID=1423810 RepID=A0A0R2CGZ2_9LACO|nr:FtsK SpoIIIE family DNA translocase [Lacticaseibacillus thailandensis DSM 22698 = JCM 13996]
MSVLTATQLGLIGVTFANMLRIVVGDSFVVAAWVLAVLGAWLLFTGKMPRIKHRVWWGFALFYVGVLLWMTATTMNKLAVHSHFLSASWAILKADFQQLTTANPIGGGQISSAIYTLTYALVSSLGSYIVAGLAILAGIMIFLGVTPAQLFDALQSFGAWLAEGGRRLRDTYTNWRTAHDERAADDAQKDAQVASRKQRRAEAKAAQTAHKADDKDLPTPHDHDEPLVGQVDTPTTADDFHINVPSSAAPTSSAAASGAQNIAASSSSASPEHAEQLSYDDALAQTGEPTDDYQLPSLDLLSQPKPVDQSEELSAIQKNRTKLEQTFKSFGVDVTVKSASLGPSITKYEIEPAVGVKVSKIVNLTDDLALALAAKDIRIEAPIPGKSLIGIEVPNAHVATVGFQEVFGAVKQHPNKPLVVPLGKTVTGDIVTSDLAKMPHLLIAGATGSGKSVMINVIITSLLMTTKPSAVRLMLIDPKKVELSIYNGIPHLLAPVVTEAKRAPAALNKILKEMERRYEAFSAAGVRNMEEYNRKVQQDPTGNAKKMPFIVVIIDELADLMMVAGSEVETAIIRIGQMARAAGIHMIIATQRPSVDVITGLIKANIPSRIAFAVSSGVDSRTILDMNGAEKLLGRGDMLYDPIDMNKPQRVQGAFIPSADVEAVVQYITNQVAPAYDESMIPTAEDEQTDEPGAEEDELFNDALAFVAQKQSASTSMLQRRFRIGYNRAARLIDDLENRGYIGPSQGSKPRQVFAKPADDQSGPKQSGA